MDTGELNMTLCRLCYEEVGQISIFSEEELPTPFAKMQLCCGGVMQVAADDGLPTTLCRACSLELDDCYRFLRVCGAAYRVMTACAASAPAADVPNTTPANKSASDEEYEMSGDNLDDNSTEAESEKKPETSGSRDSSWLEHEVIDRMKPMFTRNRKLNVVECTACGRRCTSWWGLAAHLRRHTRCHLCQCPFCEKLLKLDNVQRHVRAHVGAPLAAVCEVCGAGFSCESTLAAHAVAHTHDKPFKCRMCPVRFKRNYTRLLHERRHTNAKTVICEVCGKSFWDKKHLHVHSITHRSEKLHQCPICPSRYKHKNNLTAHMKVHT